MSGKKMGGENLLASHFLALQLIEIPDANAVEA
jgi:hypothetical protein